MDVAVFVLEDGDRFVIVVLNIRVPGYCTQGNLHWACFTIKICGWHGHLLDLHMAATSPNLAVDCKDRELQHTFKNGSKCWYILGLKRY